MLHAYARMAGFDPRPRTNFEGADRSMSDLTEPQKQMLRNLVRMGGRGADSPFRNDDGRALMRTGLIELIDPPQIPGRAKGLPYCVLTPAGQQAAESK